MELSNKFWKGYELDFQEIKLVYLSWAIGYAKKPKPEYQHLFIWDHQDYFGPINSRYGRAFAFSPFGPGVRGVPRPKEKGMPKGLDEIDIALKARLTISTANIRTAIGKALETGNLDDARQIVLNFYWIKLGPHELLFDRVQSKTDKYGKIRKNRWGLDETEKWQTLSGIRNRIVNVMRYGETLEDKYLKNLNRKLPGLSRGTQSTFLSSAISWNRYGMCAFNCGPVSYSKKGFVHFSQVKKWMNQIGWPYHGCPSQVLRPLYTIALNYRRIPIRKRGAPDEGYSLKSLRRRACQIYEIIDNLLNEINRIRSEEIG